MEKKGKNSVSESRVDKWLWAVRIFKTRSQSAEACRKGRVVIDDIPVKPSRSLKMGDIIHVRRSPALFTCRVTGLTDNRIPAKLVDQYLEDLTPDTEKEKLMNRNMVVFAMRDKGAGRPTKRERRFIDKIKNKEQ
ncbi:MAG: RNA-binding S4 domain-containing protein [Bacteroidales bacterium]